MLCAGRVFMQGICPYVNPHKYYTPPLQRASMLNSRTKEVYLGPMRGRNLLL